MIDNSPHDTLKRPLRDLRISVTDKCNFRCRYCMPSEIFNSCYAFLNKEQLLSFEEIERLAITFASLGVEKIRLTGGEPLMRPKLTELIYRLKRIKGIKEIALTTNGSLLAEKAVDLKKAGLSRVNISLDALSNETFRQINGGVGSVDDVLKGILAASEAGLGVKINMVVQKKINEHEILPMARYFKELGHTLRFIEFMDVGNSNGWKMEHVVPSEDLIKLISSELPLIALDYYYGDVAKRYRYQDSQAEIGVISSVTQPFCGSCTRARISADGTLYTCLFSNQGYDLRKSLQEVGSNTLLRDQIINIWRNRKDRYSEERGQGTTASRVKVEMNRLGG